jgi:hypothetical protein
MGNLRDLLDNIPKLPRKRSGPRFKPISTKSVRVRLIPGEYTHNNGTVHPVHEIFQHFNATVRKFQLCSAKWLTDASDPSRLERDPNSRCVGCHLIDTGSKNVRMDRKFPVTVFICDDFHLDPNGWDNKPLGFADDGAQKFRKTLCTGEGCEGCQKGLDKDWGRRMYWEVPRTYLQAMIAYQDEAADICANCGSEPGVDGEEGGLTLISLCCPGCGGQIKFDDDSQAKALIRGDVKCPSCEKIVAPDEILHCAGCNDPRRPKIFDMDLWIRTTPTSPPTLLITKAKVMEPSSKIPQHLLKPYDLPDMLRPPPIEVQCKIHKVANPWAAPASEDWE